MPVTDGPRFGLTRWSLDDDPQNREQFDGDHEALEEKAAGFLRGTIAARPAADASNVGFLYEATDEGGRLYWSTGAEWLTLDGVSFVRKTADESVASSTVLQDDDHLTLAVVANAVYTIEGLLFATWDGDGDLKLAVAGPAGATGYWVADFPDMTSDNPPNVSASAAAAIGASKNFSTTADKATIAVPLNGLIITAATPGNCKVQFAQVTSSANVTSLLARSYLKLARVA